jgi:predicted phage-related endonuclease
MQQHNLIQGSPEWKAYREQMKNASDAPVVLGLSKYKSRTAFLDEKKTGITDEIDDATQGIFDDGHRFEALARPLASKIIGKPLYPVTGSNGEYSASFDGLTILEDIAFEHKTLNDDLRAVFAEISPEHRDEAGHLLPEMYQVQMEQQLYVSGAEKCLFMASKWNGDVLVEEHHTWYLPNMELRQRILDGWSQFESDLVNHVPAVIVEKPRAQVVLELPALFIQAHGAILNSNMDTYGQALATRLAEVRAIALVTDQDFANAKEGAKLLRENIKQAKLAKDAMLEQTATVGEAARMIDAWCEDMRLTALKLEQDVEREDKLKKQLMISTAQGDFTAVINTLEEKVRPIRLNISMPNFGDAIKSKSKYASMHDAIKTLAANAEVEATRLANDVISKQTYMADVADGFEFLFADLQQIIWKAEDDFQLLVNSRIENHKRITAEREQKIIDDAKAEEALRIASEAAANAKNETPVVQEPVQQSIPTQPSNVSPIIPDQPAIESTTPASADLSTQYFAGVKPTVNEIVCALATVWKVNEEIAHAWLVNTNFKVYKKAA